MAAIKRACVFKLPQTLILHLRRLEFDLETWERFKVNDRYEFPEELDMKPFTLAGLNEKEGQPPNAGVDDMNVDEEQSYRYRLAGVLVHRGTAESGHYYSFIKKRGANSSSWLNLNDSNVSEFDIQSLKEEAFGGSKPDQVYDQFKNKYVTQNVVRPHNAYMLFYDRIPLDSRQGEESEEATAKNENDDSPRKRVRLSATETDPLSLCNEHNHWIYQEIRQDNAQFAKECAVFNEDNFVFVKRVCEATAKIAPCEDLPDPLLCSVQVAVSFLIGTMAFARERPGLDSWISLLTSMLNRSLVSCHWFLQECVANNAALLRTLFLDCPQPEMRRTGGSVILSALKQVRPEMVAACNGLDMGRLPRDIESEDAPTQYQATEMNRPIPDHVGFEVVRQLVQNLAISGHSQWRNIAELFQFLRCFLHNGVEERNYLLRIGTLDMAVEYYLQENASYLDKRKLRTSLEYHHSPFDNLLGLVVELCEAVNPECWGDESSNAVLPCSPETLDHLVGQDVTFIRHMAEMSVNVDNLWRFVRLIAETQTQLASFVIKNVVIDLPLMDSTRIYPVFALLDHILQLPYAADLGLGPYLVERLLELVELNPSNTSFLEAAFRQLVKLSETEPSVLESLSSSSREWSVLQCLVYPVVDSIRQNAECLLIASVGSNDLSQCHMFGAPTVRQLDLSEHQAEQLQQLWAFLLENMERLGHTLNNRLPYDFAVSQRLTRFLRLLQTCCRATAHPNLFGQYMQGFVFMFREITKVNEARGTDENKHGTLVGLNYGSLYSQRPWFFLTWHWQTRRTWPCL